MVSSKTIPDSLYQARRFIEGFKELTLIQDFYWLESDQSWVQLVEVNLSETRNVNVPLNTSWYIACKDSYPFDNIKVYPCKENGLKFNFPHQDYISNESRNVPWTNGFLCLTGEYASISPRSEPKGVDRLQWIYSRMLEWVKAASCNTLLKHGDRYELPALKKFESHTPFILIKEDSDSFKGWTITPSRFGYLEGYSSESINNCHLITAVQDEKYSPIVIYNWSQSFLTNKPRNPGVWLKLESCPIVTEWHAPRTWRQLQAILINNHIDLSNVFLKCFGSLDFKREIVLGLCFPIPRTVGGKFESISWFFIKIPPLLNKHTKIEQESSRRSFVKQRIENMIEQDTLINWISCRNVDDERLFSRGKLSKDLISKNILVVGAGSLGSSLCELLVRGGCEKLTVIDFDILDAGNLVRHTLTTTELFQSKVKNLSERLNSINFQVNCKYLDDSIVNLKSDELKKFDLVIDTTGEDDVISFFDSLDKKIGTSFCSISFGYGAKRSYFHFSRDWSSEEFYCDFSDLIKEDIKKIEDHSVPEGIGCWHFSFPALQADVWNQVAIATEQLNYTFINKLNKRSVAVLKTINSSGLVEIQSRLIR